MLNVVLLFFSKIPDFFVYGTLVDKHNMGEATRRRQEYR